MLTWNVFLNTMSAYKTRIADLRSKGEISIHEGKQPMSKSGYHYLAKAALMQNEDFNLYVTCYCFLLLCWNLIARVVSVGSIPPRFTKWLMKILTKNKDDILSLGLTIAELGSHSFRKGIATSLQTTLVVLLPLIYGCGLVGVSDPYRVDTYLMVKSDREC